MKSKNRNKLPFQRFTGKMQKWCTGSGGDYIMMIPPHSADAVLSMFLLERGIEPTKLAIDFEILRNQILNKREEEFQKIQKKREAIHNAWMKEAEGRYLTYVHFNIDNEEVDRYFVCDCGKEIDLFSYLRKSLRPSDKFDVKEFRRQLLNMLGSGQPNWIVSFTCECGEKHRLMLD